MTMRLAYQMWIWNDRMNCWDWYGEALLTGNQVNGLRHLIGGTAVRLEPSETAGPEDPPWDEEVR